MGQAYATSSFLVLSHGLRCAGKRPAAHRFKACPADAIRLEPLPVDALRKAAGDVSALDLPARELLFCRPAHGGHLLVAYHVSGQMLRKGWHLKIYSDFSGVYRFIVAPKPQEKVTLWFSCKSFFRWYNSILALKCIKNVYIWISFENYFVPVFLPIGCTSFGRRYHSMRNRRNRLPFLKRSIRNPKQWPYEETIIACPVDHSLLQGHSPATSPFNYHCKDKCGRKPYNFWKNFKKIFIS